MLDCQYLSKKTVRDYLKNMFSKLLPLSKVLRLKKISVIYKSLTFILLMINKICIFTKTKKIYPVMHIYNNKKKNIILIHSLKILKVSQNINFGLVFIISDNNNNNIRFYLQDITQTYIEIISDFNPNFYICHFFKLILQLSTLSDFIIKVIKLLYSKLKVNNYWLAIYHTYYIKILEITELIYNHYLVSYLIAIV